jgi:hypothetical protein
MISVITALFDQGLNNSLPQHLVTHIEDKITPNPFPEKRSPNRLDRRSPLMMPIDPDMPSPAQLKEIDRKIKETPINPPFKNDLWTESIPTVVEVFCARPVTQQIWGLLRSRPTFATATRPSTGTVNSCRTCLV